LYEKIQVYLSQKYKSKQAFINESLRRITMHAGHILTILIGFYASFAITVMSVTPLLGWTTKTQ
jgi:hypothetical protein